jgi:hypothetical protein
MMKLFNDENSADVVRALNEVVQDRGRQVRYEIQDGGMFLLLMVQIADSLSDESLEQLARDIKMSLGWRLPVLDTDYAWCVVMLRRDEVIQSVLPDMGRFTNK